MHVYINNTFLYLTHFHLAALLSSDYSSYDACITDTDCDISRTFRYVYFIHLLCPYPVLCITVLNILFISYKFVKGFLAETFMMCVNVFLYNREQISAWSDKRQRFSPQFPIIKITHFCNVMSIDMTLQMWVIFIMGVYGEISHFLSDPTEILFLVI